MPALEVVQCSVMIVLRSARNFFGDIISEGAAAGFVSHPLQSVRQTLEI